MYEKGFHRSLSPIIFKFENDHFTIVFDWNSYGTLKSVEDNPDHFWKIIYVQ